VGREDILQMRPQELKRLHLIHQVLDKQITQCEAAGIAGLSERQVRRLVKRIRQEGDRGVLHERRGQPSNRRIAEKIKQKVIRLYQTKYGDFGPTLASEKLEEIDRIEVHPETLRLWLRQAQIPYKRRKSKPHRQWRQRRACLGEMVQMDGSHHDWLEGRGPKLVLMGYIDDATNTVYARFYDHEGTLPAFDSFQRYVRRYGIPSSVYVDKHSTYKSPKPLSLEEQLEGRQRSQSQFERAMRELGVEVIHAHSPAAKGRIERLFETFQDRLIKEMRLEGINSQSAANAFLEHYLPGYNQRFRVVAAQGADLHRKIPRGLDLNSILCLKTQRRLNQDATLAYGSKLYQIEDRVQAQTLTVEERIDGSMRISHQGRGIKYREILSRPVRVRSAAGSAVKGSRHKPAADHPWRQSYRRSQAPRSASPLPGRS
jgi:transposase